MAWLKGIRAVARVLVVLAAAGFGSCGRTQLNDVDPCDPAVDTTRPCSGACGAGTESCVDYAWQACVIPIYTRPCSNDCGDGVESCVDGVWGETCEVPPAMRDCSTVCGSGSQACNDGVWAACDAPRPLPPILTTTVRDFHKHNPPDFEFDVTALRASGFGPRLPDLGIVQSALGADGTPVYAGNPTTKTTTGAANFAEWYHDVPGVNLRTMIDLPLMASASEPDFYVYDNPSFFPIDNQLFGNEGDPHNYSFTLEAHTHFLYHGGEIFSFSGDDDCWVFINGTLVIDLGGVHEPLSDSVELDAAASALAMVKGQSYPLDVFFAERHTIGSTFTIRTSIADASSCP
jgi:fibro-slime domain-containing protein